VIGHRHRLDKGAQLQRHVVGQLVQHACRDDGVLGHATVGHQSVEADLRADVVVARSTRGALPAFVDRFDGDPIAFLPSRHAGCEIGDDAREFVSDGQRQLRAGERMGFGGNEDRPGVVLVQVGAADPVETDLFTVPGRGSGSGTSATSTLFGP
jgi:hypothetical protein